MSFSGFKIEFQGAQFSSKCDSSTRMLFCFLQLLSSFEHLHHTSPPLSGRKILKCIIVSANLPQNHNRLNGPILPFSGKSRLPKAPKPNSVQHTSDPNLLPPHNSTRVSPNPILPAKAKQRALIALISQIRQKSSFWRISFFDWFQFGCFCLLSPLFYPAYTFLRRFIGYGICG